MDLLIFDLDGTLIDSRLDLANAVNAMLAHLGMSTLSNERVYSYVGNGAPVLVRRALGDRATEEEFRQALAFFMEYYAAHDLEYTTLYPGVRESLDRFGDAGKRMAVLTNKPTAMSRHILEGLDVSGHFFQIFGGDSFPEKKPHPIGVETLMQEAGVDRAHSMIVGDSGVDVATARNAGVACCGVTYGFQPESLHDPAPDILVDRMEQFADWLLNK
jgi:phosphoglycolate phosphatase